MKNYPSCKDFKTDLFIAVPSCAQKGQNTQSSALAQGKEA